MDATLKLDADFAVSLHPSEVERFDRDIYLLNESWGWTGWKARQWPADVIRPGLKFYKFDLRPDKRRLCALLAITRGGAFEFSSMDEFEREVVKLTGRRPHSGEDDDSKKKWAEVEKRLADHHRCTGICFCWDVVQPASVNLPGQFPRLGWCDLTKPNYGML